MIMPIAAKSLVFVGLFGETAKFPVNKRIKRLKVPFIIVQER